ncbi:hypothetical protein [Methylocella tundrae]|uniref:Uncharacterized protein n=1 Tax=Methylocella tundrae TaxID=227605 RepID=A0A4U8Z7P0_METTU|nr:hypothetical protein [Methylocella tundrae]WPP02785.1 hypothetical protein SIN04_00310 [Methylocella tundrae]VFU17577.1 conserved membrane protein of unknown function [Methylocella tundrae]
MNSPSSAIAGWRKPAWIALLAAASVAFTLGFACATPLAAFAAIAALTMTRRDALLLVGLVWGANQCVGFGVLHYPWTVDCLAWGLALGVIALLSVFAAEFGAKRLIGRNGILASIAAFLAAFAVYEGLLFLTSIIVQSGVENYGPLIIGRIFAINAVAFVGLLAVSKLGASAGLVSAHSGQLAETTGRRG